MALSTDFQDDVLNTSANTKRKYQMTENGDGTVSFDDVTSYSQTGSDYGAKEIIEEREAINQMGGYQIIWRRYIDFSQSAVPSLGTTTINGTFTLENDREADQIWAIPIAVSYGNVYSSITATSSATGSGNYTISVSVPVMNLTTETHTIIVYLLIIGVASIS